MSDLADPKRGSPGRELDDRVPGMPAVHVHSEYGEMPVPLADGLSPTIGWQWLPEKKGGPVFAVITRTRLGSPLLAGCGGGLYVHRYRSGRGFVLQPVRLL